jgi:hypothetical protein
MTAPQLSQPLESVASAPRASTATRTRRGRSNWLQQTVFYLLVALFIIFCLAPFIWTLDTSLKGDDTIFTVPVRYIPSPIDLSNYNKIFHLSRFTHSLLRRHGDLALDRLGLRLRPRPAAIPRQESHPGAGPRHCDVPRYRHHWPALPPV